MVKKILLCGCGGVGGYVARELNRLILNDQIDIDDTYIYVADNDIVEAKNIRYQNFKKEDVFKKKSKVIAERYCFVEIPERIETDDQLKDYDLIIIGVDNSATRKRIYEYCYANDKHFIDLRAEGRAIAFFTKDADKDKLIGTLGDSISDKGSSCQLDYDLKNGIIQNGNVIIASIGSQLVLNWLRGEKNQNELILRI